MYNIPARVVINMPPELLAELGAVDNIVAVKQANDDELGPIEGLEILAGNDNTFLRVLEFGGAGGITVASHVAGHHMREMWDAAQAGDIARAREIDAELTPLYEGLSVTTNPIPIKAALEMLGLDLGADAAAAGPSGCRAAGRGQSRAGGHRPSARHQLTNFRRE